MLKLSLPLEFINQIAANEAKKTKHESVKPEHLFIGLCSIEKLIDKETQNEFKIAPSVALELLDEWRAISTLFQSHQVNMTDLRHEMEKCVEMGNNENQEVSIQNSKETGQVLERAKEIAQHSNDSNVNTLHLLEALIENADDKIEKLFEAKSLKIDSLKQSIADLMIARSKRKVVTTKGKSILVLFGRDLVKLAHDGKIKEAIGNRSKDAMLRIIQVLSLEEKSNPILIGEAGVGKTAIVEGLAWRIAHADQGKVPEHIKDKKIIQISVTDLLAGSKYRGDVEERINKLIQEVRESPDIVLFIDEIHTIIGAGATGDAMDIANMLKPALARGELRCIGATTTTEYYKYFGKDSAFERRFQTILISEPNKQETLEILRSVCERKASFHKVDILPDAFSAAIEFSARYLPDRNFPDKAIEVLETACSVAANPEISMPIAKKIEKKAVTRKTIIQVVTQMTGFPIAFDYEDLDKDRLLNMANNLKKRVIGQDEACEIVANTIVRSYSGLKDPDAPLGVILFIGPTGVGKTELAKATTEFLFGNEQAMHRLDMSEYQESHSTAKLIGAPPGYVGYEEEGQLTGKLRRRPFAVVLLDEIEKAHKDVRNLFLQLFEDGRLTDSKGRTIDATHALFILTSNIKARDTGFPTSTQQDIRLNLVNHGLAPEFVNRIDEIVSFSTFTNNDLENIATLLIANISERLKEKNIKLKVESDAIKYLCKEGYNPQLGARPMKRIIEKNISNLLSREFMNHHIKSGDAVTIMLENDKFVYKTDKK